jgi:hypothetical protein
MTAVYKAEDAQSRWRSAFDSAIVRLVLLAGAIRSAQLGWVALIAHVFDTELRGLFSKPVFALLPWLLGAIASAFLVYWIGVRLLERREVSELALAGAARYLPFLSSEVLSYLAPSFAFFGRRGGQPTMDTGARWVSRLGR